MKYYLYNYMWKKPQHDSYHSATKLRENKDIVELYEQVFAQEEEIYITHLVEITKEQFDRAQNNGLIG